MPHASGRAKRAFSVDGQSVGTGQPPRESRARTSAGSGDPVGPAPFRGHFLDGGLLSNVEVPQEAGDRRHADRGGPRDRGQAPPGSGSDIARACPRPATLPRGPAQGSGRPAPPTRRRPVPARVRRRRASGLLQCCVAPPPIGGRTTAAISLGWTMIAEGGPGRGRGIAITRSFIACPLPNPALREECMLGIRNDRLPSDNARRGVLSRSTVRVAWAPGAELTGGRADRPDAERHRDTGEQV